MRDVPDARVDPEWEANEDLVKFGLGTYLGYPINNSDGELLGTICALHGETFDFDAGDPSLGTHLERLRSAVKAGRAVFRTGVTLDHAPGFRSHWPWSR